MNHSVKIIGLTGAIGCGKSTVTQELKNMKMPVFDADYALHEWMKSEKAKKVTPWQAWDSKKGVIREKIRKWMLMDPRFECQWMDITGQALKEERRQWMNALKSEEKNAVWDVPLLMETGWFKDVDEVWIVHCHEEVQKKRIRARGQWDEDTMEKMLSRHWSLEKKIKMLEDHHKSYILIENDGSLEDLKVKVEGLWSARCG